MCLGGGGTTFEGTLISEGLTAMAHLYSSVEAAPLSYPCDARPMPPPHRGDPHPARPHGRPLPGRPISLLLGVLPKTDDVALGVFEVGDETHVAD